jgi:predicted outer membrane protein
MAQFNRKSAAVALYVAAVGVLLAQTAPGLAGRQQPPSRGTDFPPGNTRDFISAMTIAGMTEIQLGNLAITRASHPDVKAFGQLMVKDHSMANTELRSIAMQLNVTQPTELDQKHRDLFDRLTNVGPTEFDREYTKAMIEGHQEVAKLLRSRTGPAGGAAAGATAVGTSGTVDVDPLTRWARQVLPTVEQHLERAQQLQQNIK